MINVAVGTLSAWNELTQDERDYFDGGHYLLLSAAVDEHPGGSAIDEYKYTIISDTDNNTKAIIPNNTNNHNIYIDGGGYTFNSNHNDTDIEYMNNVGNQCDIHIYNFKVNIYINKVPAHMVFARFPNLQNVNLYFYDNKINGHNKDGRSVYYYQGTGKYIVYNNIFLNYRGAILYDNTDTATAKIENNTCISSPDFGIGIIYGIAELKNNTCINCVADIDGTYTDEGGNATSDDTGSTGYTNLTGTDIMVDPANGDYRPKLGGALKVPYTAPIIDGNTTYYDKSPKMPTNSYAGALGRIEGVAAEESNPSIYIGL